MTKTGLFYPKPLPQTFRGVGEPRVAALGLMSTRLRTLPPPTAPKDPKWPKTRGLGGKGGVTWEQDQRQEHPPAPHTPHRLAAAPR